MTTFVLVILAASVALLGWAFARSTLRQFLAAGLVVTLAVCVVATMFEGPVGGARHDVLVLFAVVLAVCGGGVVTSAVFEAIDGRADTRADGRADGSAGGSAGRTVAAGDVLRGGTWIGALERLAVFGSLAALWPEGVAIVLAVKGLGRYPELRTGDVVTAERFIIGTMVSVIWAVACVYLAFAPYVVPVR